nr:conserved hypothetical protein [uncultured bacterium]
MRKLVLAVCIFQLVALPLLAQEQYGPERKLGRGLSNFLFSITEIPRQVSMVRQDNGTFAGVTWGLVKGMSCFAGRTILGAYETVTFLAPTYKPLVKPEFILNADEEESLERTQAED